ncbi:MAG: WYL domain-containing protein [Pirellulales bacterium]|nr:WYL domain-containing protein [Pirellulales bacterium]
MNLERVTRLLRLVHLLQGGRGHNTASLALECGVSRRTIFRDLDVLRQAGVPLVFDDRSQHYRIPEPFLLPATSFSPQEALALILLCQQAGNHKGVPFLTAAQSAALKLESVFPARLRDYLQAVSGAIDISLPPRNPLTTGQDHFDQLVAAIAARRCVRIEYDSLTEWTQIRTRLSPYRLMFSRRSWYIIGRSSLHRATRTFNIGRILRLETTDDRYQVPRGFHLDRYLRNAWHLIPERGKDQDVVIRFQKQVAQNVAEVAWHKTQRVAWNEDGTMDFHVRVSGLHEISWWILGYGDQAEVLQPSALRELIAGRVRKMAEHYRIGREPPPDAPRRRNDR